MPGPPRPRRALPLQRADAIAVLAVDGSQRLVGLVAERARANGERELAAGGELDAAASVSTVAARHQRVRSGTLAERRGIRGSGAGSPSKSSSRTRRAKLKRESRSTAIAGVGLQHAVAVGHVGAVPAQRIARLGHAVPRPARRFEQPQMVPFEVVALRDLDPPAPRRRPQMLRRSRWLRRLGHRQRRVRLRARHRRRIVAPAPDRNHSNRGSGRVRRAMSYEVAD